MVMRHRNDSIRPGSSSPILSLLFLSLTVLLLFSRGGETTAQSNVVALVGGHLFPSPEALPIDDATIVIENRRVVVVGPRAKVAIPPGAMTLDCTNLFVVAGFQNSHVHFTEEQWAAAETQASDKLASQLRTMITSYGFTTVVDTGSLLQNTVALRKRIESGQVAGPRIFTAGLPLYPPDGIPYYLKDGSIPPDLLRLLPQPSTPQEVVSVVDANADGGADIIKLFTGSWVTNQRVLPMPVDLATAAVKEAHRRKKLVFSHTSSPAGLEVTLAAGVDVIAHALDDTRGFTSDHLRRMKRQNVAFIPTLTLFGDSGNANEIFREIRDYAALGGDILFGTDVGYHPIYDPRIEYEALKKAGLTWQQVLASLTTAPARRFNEISRRGTVARGKDADLVVLDADPRVNPIAFASVRYTIRAGKIIFQRNTN
jgi:imidazolonepropionase-like amidohydrolase